MNERKKRISINHRNQIRPIFQMLNSKKDQLSKGEWMNFVNRTETSIIHSPDQYLAEPENGDEETVVKYLFNEFLNRKINKF